MNHQKLNMKLDRKLKFQLTVKLKLKLELWLKLSFVPEIIYTSGSNLKPVVRR